MVREVVGGERAKGRGVEIEIAGNSGAELALELLDV